MGIGVNTVTLIGLLALAGPGLGRLQAQNVLVRAKVSDRLPSYQPRARVTGAVAIPFTDALADLGDEWNKGFHKFHPDGSLAFLPGESSEAVKALLGGTAPLVILSRELTAEEKTAFQGRFGYRPMRFPVCLDATIVFVNKANPITAISMEQLDAIYSRNRLGGAAAPALVWGDLGVKGDMAQRIIHAYALPEGTATRAAFAATALGKGSYRDGLLQREDAPALSDAVSSDLAGIAFGPMASWFATTRTLPVAPFHGGEARYPTQEQVTAGQYPMPGIFYGYLNRAPGRPMDPAVNEALHFLLAQEGQAIVADVGLLPGPVEQMNLFGEFKLY